MRLILFILVFFALSPSQAELPERELPPRTLGEVEIQGDGAIDLLLIPCMSCRWAQYEEFMRRNKDRYTMYAVTLPGFGGAPSPEIPYAPERLVWRQNAYQALLQLIEDHDLNDLYVVGHSYGSSFAVELAASIPERIAAVVNVDGFIALGRVDNVWRIPDSDAGRMEVLEETERDYMTPLLQPDEWRKFNKAATYATTERQLLYHGMFMATDKKALFAYWAENQFFDIDPILSRLTVPVLDIESIPPNGDQQKYIDRRHAVIKTSGASENVRTIFFLDTYHFVMDHRPKLLDDVVFDFVRGKKLERVYSDPNPTQP